MSFARFASLAIAVAALACGASAGAAPILRDLGDGLRYMRTTSLPGDLPASANNRAPTALVLDLRAIDAAENTSTSLARWLRAHARPDAPIFALVNHDTAPPLFRVLLDLSKLPGLLTLGTATESFTPDIVVPVDLETERQALQEIEKGSPLQQLTREDAAKDRVDEAVLVREQRGEPAEPARTAPRDELSDEAAPAAPPAPLVDRTLQRAIHTHRALRALKRL